MTANCEFECEKVHFEVRDTKKKETIIFGTLGASELGRRREKKKIPEPKKNRQLKNREARQKQKQSRGTFQRAKKKNNNTKKNFFNPTVGKFASLQQQEMEKLYRAGGRNIVHTHSDSHTSNKDLLHVEIRVHCLQG